MPCEGVWSDPIHGQADHCGGVRTEQGLELVESMSL